MECREACKAMTSFLEGTYPVAKQEAFIQHVEDCPDCQEELLVCMRLHMALNALDENTDVVYSDSDENLKIILENAMLRVAHYNRYRSLKAAITTIAGWALLLILALQLLYWIQVGFL